MAAPAITKLAGNIRLWRINNDGSHTPAIPNTADPTGNQAIEANAMVFSREEGESTEITSKQRDNRYGQVIFQDQDPGTTSMALTLLEVPPLIFARVLYGTAANEVQVAAGSVVEAALAIPFVDRPIQLPHKYLDDSPAVVIEKAAVALVAGTDYVIDHRRGQVSFRGAAVTAGAADITISYTYFAHKKILISGGGSPTEKFFVTGDMQNRVSLENGELEIHQFNATIDGEVDLLSSEPISPVLSGPLVTPSGKNEPYTFEVSSLVAP